MRQQASSWLERGASATPWAIAFAEGFSTLAVEVIAIRLAVPIVGSSITLTGVMLGVVLLALSAGYWRGGALSARWDKPRTRAALARNLALAALLYGALAFPFEAPLLEKLLDWDWSLAAAIGGAATLLFLAPIYLASQTVPMLAEVTNVDGKAGKASGKVLFFSTVGSVAGGIVTPVWLFPSLGVARSTWVVCGLLAVAAAVMAADRLRLWQTVAAGTALVALVAGSQAWAGAGPGLASLYSFDSPYQTIRVVHERNEGGRLERRLVMGGGRASGVWDDTGETSVAYVIAAEQAMAELAPRRNLLVIGAAGFTFPRDAARDSRIETIDAVDLDPVVKSVAESEFLRRPLPAKVRFYPLSARYAVRRFERTGRRYDFAFLDAYCGKGVPDELLTEEFFRDIARVSRHTAANTILDRGLASAFARNLLASFRAAFGAAWVRPLAGEDPDDIVNVMVTDWPAAGSAEWKGSGAPYHDDRNAADADHVRLVWGRD